MRFADFKMAEFKFSEGHYFANVIGGIINGPKPYLRNLGAFWGDSAIFSLISPYNKYSALHFRMFTQI